MIDGVSRETLERLTIFADLLRKWNPSINLVSRGTIPDLWDRHIVDSVQVYNAAPSGKRDWLDIGSGGGFPGLVAVIIGAEKHPSARFHLIESDQRKCVFLNTVLREIGLKATVISQRIEQAEPLGADILSARALAPLDQLLDMAQIHMSPDGTALFPKGRQWRNEIADAQVRWRFQHEVLPSKTDPEAVILRIKEIEHV
ncbi:ribosomal RNA small subunit methyltransferase G [Primorskyibacter flagellatus]|uniref:Ribosomal RNA small subunit methyltransferase G n=1 Tax=Primorskyibacter flagellatus TaxID=1387277 RepID=A0A917AF40_9RHOB|nr:16S rRNA (guanine(527)-N(7))-methyltransferase RsmG [Primorskyibacter flagellatus]GGE46271.1 ribosomal RNA small subunit methyltransferase G [Primorskyibacter flagellatus]